MMRRPGDNDIAKVPAGLWYHTDLEKAIMTDKRTRVDLGQHDRCTMAQRRRINPEFYRSELT
jgi:hypothetical protein